MSGHLLYSCWMDASLFQLPPWWDDPCIWSWRKEVWCLVIWWYGLVGNCIVLLLICPAVPVLLDSYFIPVLSLHVVIF
jgi:hypothetical protein